MHMFFLIPIRFAVQIFPSNFSRNPFFKDSIYFDKWLTVHFPKRRYKITSFQNLDIFIFNNFKNLIY